MTAWDEFRKRHGIGTNPEDWLNAEFEVLRIMVQTPIAALPSETTLTAVTEVYDLVRLIREAVHALREDGRYAWIVVSQKNDIREQGRYRVSGVA